jgi:hypothetical protein
MQVGAVEIDVDVNIISLSRAVWSAKRAVVSEVG